MSTSDTSEAAGAVPVDNRLREKEQQFLRDLKTQRRRNSIRQLALNVLGIVLFLAAWEAMPNVIPWMNRLLFPPPSDVVGTLKELIESGELLENIRVSLIRVLNGFAIATVLGTLTGLVTGRTEALQHLTDPILHGMRSIPAIALVPLSLLWFGIGEPSSVSMTPRQPIVS